MCIRDSFEAVQIAQRALVAEEVTKAYLPAAGDQVFLDQMKGLVFGDELVGDGKHITAIQTPVVAALSELLLKCLPRRLPMPQCG